MALYDENNNLISILFPGGLIDIEPNETKISVETYIYNPTFDEAIQLIENKKYRLVIDPDKIRKDSNYNNNSFEFIAQFEDGN